ncbi:N-formylglutamate deformylase [Herbaspirillum sp. WKF16]|uniref:N-formylglutamate deformylase n=1 Tax=Herbaspirillum sp. WKF16 TaxID=3028312 RepID=UPI0023A9460B|nr:N-formylglutamate deformylase [Herbaspirillum sp. WKF16]WDZ95928.1 N-formylglutamate deformylase [Herbaspirillum sp. WKF16]
MQTTSFDFHQGSAPLLISIPHMGTFIPPALAAGMTPAASAVADTDWHLDRLYAFAESMGASFIRARASRYVIDLNRPPDDESLYPGQTTTSLCPTETFRGEPLYRPGCEPSAEEVRRRLEQVWQPYHQRLEQELQRLRAAHGCALLWDGHSIASHLPRLFEGKLPDFNIGTNQGQSCSPAIGAAVSCAAQHACEGHPAGFTWVANGRFKGGYITRRYGRPALGIHAVQMEMCQSLYMDEHAPFGYLPERAHAAVPVVRGMIDAALAALRAGAATSPDAGRQAGAAA